MTGAGSVLNGGKITNDGLIEGTGNVKNNIDNATGAITAGTGVLDLSGSSVTNDVGGSISSAAGTEGRRHPGHRNNAGLISLSGGEFSSNNNALGNTGQITGYGILNTALAD